MFDRTDDGRLRVLQSTQLLDSPPEHAFDRLTRLASGLLGAPTALLSLVDEKRQFFKSALGLAEPWASLRETPLSHSFCRYATRDRAPLIVEDARTHPVLRENLAVRDLGVVAYAGIPLIVAGEAIGAFCVIDDKPRAWSDADIHLLQDLAESVVAEIDLRLSLREAQEQRALVDALIESMGDGVLAADPSQRFLIANGAARRIFLSPTNRAESGRPLPLTWTKELRSTLPSGAALAVEDGALRRGLRGESTDGLEFTVQPSGEPEPRWFEATGRPVRDGKGEVIAAVAVYRDVTEKKLRADRYAALAGNIPNGLALLFDKDLRCVAIDGQLARAGGTRTDDLVGQTVRALARSAGSEEGYDGIEAAFRRALLGESETVDVAGPSQTLALHIAPVRDGLGRINGGIVLTLDVTRERSIQAELQKSSQVYRAIMEHLPNGGVMMVDREMRYVCADGPVMKEIVRVAGVPTLLGRSVTELASDANRDQVVASYERAFRGERSHFEVKRGDRCYDLNVVPISDGATVTHALVFLYDVTERRAHVTELEEARSALQNQARELREASVTDDLTGLLNRRGFMLIADQEMKVAVRTEQKLVLFFVDLNGMKTINDSLGHEEGDRALKDTATLLRKLFRESDVIARLGGDEFVVLATDAVATSGPAFAVRLRAALVDYNATSPRFRLSLSVGTSVFDPKDPLTLDKLISEADASMYAEKQIQHRSSGFNRIKLS